MTNDQIMKSHLHKRVISPLLENGFTGKHPHFRRECDDCIELISFQTNKYGGAFTVEVSAVFPNGKNKNYTLSDGFAEEQLTVWHTNQRYRLKGMYDGWFYYRDLYAKRSFGFGTDYIDVSENKADVFVQPSGYKLVQTFNEKTAAEICDEVNFQLEKAFKWLSRLKKHYT